MSEIILPGATIGMLGGGQLGRMFTQSAKQHGYRVIVLSPESQSPAGQVADKAMVADYEDEEKVIRFAEECDVVTYEFENVPTTTTHTVSTRTRVWPSPDLLYVSQNRLREKESALKAGFDVTPHHPISCPEDFDTVPFSFPAVLKTATAGYDGKGQCKVANPSEARKVYHELGGGEQVLEQFISIACELSVVVARNARGSIFEYDIIQNQHQNHILDVSVTPALRNPKIESEIKTLALRLATQLELVGVMTVEMFETLDGKLLFNELAPRPHNSGHLTIEAYETSQFEQQLRAVCGLPLGSTNRRSPAAAMANLLGNLWTYDPSGKVTGSPHWSVALAKPDIHLHLYGKQDPRPGRKMGHLTVLAKDPHQAETRVREARSKLIS